MPGSQRETQNAEEEGVEFVWLSAPKGFSGGTEVDGVMVQKMRLGAPDATGRQMPELIERGYVYIAQPPLFKVKVGREEMYLKDEAEEAEFMLKLALRDAVLTPSEGAAPITGEALSDYAHRYVKAKA